MKSKIPALSARKQYTLGALSETEADKSPLRQFRTWMEDAIQAGVEEPNAMSVSTVSEGGRPSSRIVLLRGYDETGFLFFTNYSSRKGKEVSLNRYASLLFFWKELERQIRIEGEIVRAASEVSDSYFRSRPRESRISAAASPQSKPVASRNELEKLAADTAGKCENSEIPRPRNWGGYILMPDYYEFWQGRKNRLHDRLSYSKKRGGWKMTRLAP